METIIIESNKDQKMEETKELTVKPISFFETIHKMGMINNKQKMDLSIAHCF